MGRKYITVSASNDAWGEVPEGFDSGVEARKICEAARQHGIVAYLNERPPMDMRDRGEEIDWWSVWCSEGYDWCELDWSDFFASHAVISAQDFVDSIHHPVVFFAGVGCPAGETIAILEGTDLPFPLDEVYNSTRIVISHKPETPCSTSTQRLSRESTCRTSTSTSGEKTPVTLHC